MGKKTKYARHLKAGHGYVRKSDRGEVSIWPSRYGYELQFIPAEGGYASPRFEETHFGERRLSECLRYCAKLVGKPAYTEHYLNKGGELVRFDPDA